jgi:hypothetical protein
VGEGPPATLPAPGVVVEAAELRVRGSRAPMTTGPRGGGQRRWWRFGASGGKAARECRRPVRAGHLVGGWRSGKSG